jgi:hypothetical protein
MLIMAGLDGTGQFKIPAIVFGFVSECLLLRSKWLTDFDVLNLDCPFLILHTIIMAPGSGTFKKKAV